LAQKLVQGLEMAAGLREKTALWDVLVTREAPLTQPAAPGVVISFSGGVADCIETDHPPFAFGDIGPILGRAIRKSRLCQGDFLMGEETIRATVIGAGCHSAQLSGSTVFCQNVTFPLKNLPVLAGDSADLAQQIRGQDGDFVVSLGGLAAPSYDQVTDLARQLTDVMGAGPIYLCLRQDMAKALGQALALRLGKEHPILCLDRVQVSTGSFLDVGAPVGPALPVVVKTLVLGDELRYQVK
jgi:ethanolamine utilization protein EutA